MKTIYAARASAPSPDKRAAAQALVESWLEERFPFEDRKAGTAVRVVDEESWFRVSIDQHVDDELSIQTQIALRTTTNTLAFEARQVVVPRRVKVVRRKLPTPTAPIRRLVQSMVDLIGAVDAGVPITSRPVVVTTDLDARGAAALCEAPSRALPVLLESPLPNGDAVFGATKAAAPLAGLAHVVVLADDRGRRAFNDGWGADLLAPGSLTIVWPDRSTESTPSDQRFSPAGARSELIARIERITEIAAESLPVLPRPRPTSRRTPTVPTRVVAPSVEPPSGLRAEPPAEPSVAPSVAPSVGASVGAAVDDDLVVDVDADGDDSGRSVTMAELLGVLDELQQAWDRVDDLQSALAAADAMVAESNRRNDALESRLDVLVSAKVDLEIRLGRKPDALKASSAVDALAQARLACRHLDFVGDYSDLADLTGIDPTALLVDLYTLDSVAVQWRAGTLNDTTFGLACRNVGLDFAADISDTARHEYAEDYAITWQGQTVLATAHVRRGRGVHLYRIHLHLDRERRRVVVGHIGRHLRGKRD